MWRRHGRVNILNVLSLFRLEAALATAYVHGCRTAVGVDDTAVTFASHDLVSRENFSVNKQAVGGSKTTCRLLPPDSLNDGLTYTCMH